MIVFNKLINILTLAFLFMVWNLSAVAETMESVSGVQFLSMASTSTDKVEIYAAGHALNVPRNYLETANLFRGRVDIGIYAIFPSFLGVDSSNFERMNLGRVLSNTDVIWIRRIDASQGSAEFRQKIIEQIKNSNNINNVGALVDVHFVGLNVKVGIKKPVEQSVIILCNFENVTPMRCDVRYEAASNLVFSYEFDSRLLSRWQDLDTGVQKLMSSFIRY